MHFHHKVHFNLPQQICAKMQLKRAHFYVFILPVIYLPPKYFVYTQIISKHSLLAWQHTADNLSSEVSNICSALHGPTLLYSHIRALLKTQQSSPNKILFCHLVCIELMSNVHNKGCSLQSK